MVFLGNLWVNVFVLLISLCVPRYLFYFYFLLFIIFVVTNYYERMSFGKLNIDFYRDKYMIIHAHLFSYHAVLIIPNMIR